jgi:hypothetical protein
MPALVAGIHAFLNFETKDVDGRDKPGHDGFSGANGSGRAAHEEATALKKVI